ncbi:hypothetical protein D3H55_18060 [Bacillus salacetis]|uniref:Stage II sporulation protein P n=1 Tax=Bacillus salacetis TaxID=2315464 RepID=A0A3A1QV10_9BACI|nr:stage II sporulation protein P [Bacillus salacetis]RIW29683.1 hypothetical protein D3H55_18060 [Bacillus salacetis]
MHKNQELLSHLKHSKEFLPSKDFNQKTLSMLVDEEAKYLRKKRVYRYSYLSFSLMTSIALICWLSFGNLHSNIQDIMSTLPSTTSSSIKETEIYIYHTHSRESFIPELNNITNAEQAHNKKRNISLVGQHLAKTLKESGIKVKHEYLDFITELEDKNLDYESSYDMSRPYVTEMVKQNSDSLKMVLDVHRDSQPRNVTTFEYQGESLGRVAFFVSSNIKNFEEVKQFAEKVHQSLERKLPGMSRGVFIKNNSPVQSTYNQDLFNHSLSVNIGGVENTLDEEFRTADILAEVLNDLHLED